jgi:hypothetical protein
MNFLLVVILSIVIAIGQGSYQASQSANDAPYLVESFYPTETRATPYAVAFMTFWCGLFRWIHT